ncbi:MAG TPA: inorganic phosphate transporter [bacterium]|nr:inorganic phosphate transporter [bacterium]HOL47112.1 inorganic phosphate transporter [bacterium]HPQ18866.1 inorganic phosphate transporter [bacterium]
MENLLLIFFSIFIAINMGASGFSVSFVSSIGSKTIEFKKAIILFTLFVLLGAIIVGGRVTKTLGGKIIEKKYFTNKVAIIILTSAGITLFIANILKIPQSTSIITICAISGIGLYYKNLNFKILLKLIIIWLIISIMSYIITYFLSKIFYPPSNKNLKYYEKIFQHNNKLSKFVLYTDLYSAFGIGTNNVANIVAPLNSAGKIDLTNGLIFFSLLFGLGAFLLGKRVIKTISNDIIPIGVFSATIISFVVSTFIIISSIFGLPAPYVQFSSLTVIAIKTVKEELGHIISFKNPVIKKIIKIWVITPIISLVISFVLMNLIRG